MGYRFALGDKVLCRVGVDEWAPGTVVALDYTEEGMAKAAPYQVNLWEGGLIWVPVDSEELCKAFHEAWWGKFFAGSRLAPDVTVEMLVAELAKNDANEKDYMGDTLLHTCVRCGIRAAVAPLLAAKADPNAGGEGMVRPLQAAVYSGDLEVLKQLLAAKADPNLQDKDPQQSDDMKSITFADREWHRTALHYAASRDLAATSALLAARADVAVIDGQYKTALHLALEANRLDTAEALLTAGAAVDAGNASSGMSTSPLIEAAYKGEMEKLELLLKSGAKVDQQGKQGMTALHLAARGRHKGVVERLLAARADATLRAESGKTALELAQANGEEDIAALLGADGAAKGSGAWKKVLDSARALAQQKKFFEALQQANNAGDLLAAELGFEGERLMEEPMAVVSALDAAAAKEGLGEMLQLRGDILVGLGAAEKGKADYAAAEACGSGAKKARLELAPERRSGFSDKVPCSILTGFLGSGKTTLLNHILKEKHGKKIAVIENEFGEVGIDDALVDSGGQSEENIVEMNNGCICCTIRGDLVQGLRGIFTKAEARGKALDGVIIETTGLADPAPVAQTFFADDFVQQHYELDGIITLVDSKHLIQHLDEEKPEGVENEAVEQLAFADRIMLNKCDLASEEELAEVERRIRAINGGAPMKRTTNSVIDMDFVIGIKAFCLDRILLKEASFLEDEQEHQHDSRVSSVGVDVLGEVDNDRLQDWIGKLLKEKGVDIFRSKGVLAVRGKRRKFVFQAIHMLFAGNYGEEWKPMERRRSKMIFIGKNLNREELSSGFKACLVTKAAR